MWWQRRNIATESMRTLWMQEWKIPGVQIDKIGNKEDIFISYLFNAKIDSYIQDENNCKGRDNLINMSTYSPREKCKNRTIIYITSTLHT